MQCVPDRGEMGVAEGEWVCWWALGRWEFDMGVGVARGVRE